MSNLRFSVNETPPVTAIPWLGLQHVLTMLGATIAVPAILANAFGLSSAETSVFVSNVLLVMGIATLLQVFVGSKLPVIQGSSFAFLPAMIYVSTIHSGSDGLSYAAGAFIIGAFIQVAFGFSQVAGMLQRILTPVVIGPTIIVIGLSLFSVGGSQASGNWWIASLTIFLILILSFGLSFLGPRKGDGSIRPLLSRYPVVISITVVWVLSFVLTSIGFFDAASPSAIKLDAVSNQPIFRLPEIFPWGVPKFDFSFLLVFMIAYMVSTVESIGDYNAINEISHREPSKLSPNTVNRGVLAEGLGCITAGLFGGTPTTSYSENIGVIGITGVASRAVIVAAALILIVVGLIPSVGGILSTIPAPVMGGLYCVLFGMIVGVGLRYAAKADLVSMRNVSIIGFSLFIGFAVPSNFASQEAKDAILLSLGNDFGTIVLGLLTSNMGMTAFSSLIFDNLLLGKSEG